MERCAQISTPRPVSRQPVDSYAGIDTHYTPPTFATPPAPACLGQYSGSTAIRPFIFTIDIQSMYPDVNVFLQILANPGEHDVKRMLLNMITTSLGLPLGGDITVSVIADLCVANS